ncbi:phosphotransferase family protein [Nocardia sp. NPDC050630]|uniref:phosphotransferase family protein n=1 Tax=Nocardia sp. NPDC050630 TaxID=3364321 RepID=UPI003793E0DF
MTAELADNEVLSVLRTACLAVGLDPEGAELLGLSENAIYKLPGDVVVRISRTGQRTAARREVDVARWLENSGIQAVQVIPHIEQPVEVDGRSVTFWRELPPHQHGTPAQVAAALKQLHALAPPADFTLGELAPFVRLEERIEAASILSDGDRQWMREYLAELRQRWDELPEGLPWCVIHGDAWVGNVVSTNDGRVILLDLERTSIGPPEWDLVHTAIKQTSFGWISAKQYAEFCDVYGYDVTDWVGFGLLRDIREFRMTTMAAQSATENPKDREQAAHRLACIRSDCGPRPWSGWRALS